MKNSKWMLLQLFAGEGGAGAAGGAGDGGVAASATGENSADAGQRLLELGVPKDKIRRRATRNEVSLPEGAIRTAPTPAPTQVSQEQAAAAVPTEEKQEAKRLTWAEIMADPEYNQEMQKTMRARLSKSKSAENALAQLTPALQIMARSYGLNTDQLDYSALAEKITADDKLYEQKALELGVAPEIARKLDQFDMMQERQKNQQKKTMQEQAMQRHYAGLLQQGEALKQKIPGFDLQQELKNRTFFRLTAPGVGFSVEEAYGMVHRKEIQQAVQQVTAQQMANAIQAGAARPDENGVASYAPSVATFDYRSASKDQRAALKKAIRDAAARGEKLYPGR